MGGWEKSSKATRALLEKSSKAAATHMCMLLIGRLQLDMHTAAAISIWHCTFLEQGCSYRHACILLEKFSRAAVRHARFYPAGLQLDMHAWSSKAAARHACALLLQLLWYRHVPCVLLACNLVATAWPQNFMAFFLLHLHPHSVTSCSYIAHTCTCIIMQQDELACAGNDMDIFSGNTLQLIL